MVNMQKLKKIIYRIIYHIGRWIDIKDFYPNEFSDDYVLVQFMNSDGKLHVPIVAKYDEYKRCWLIPFGMSITPDNDIYPVCWKNISHNKYNK